MDNWKQIWNKREVSDKNNLTLETLIMANGFDSGAGRFNYENRIR